MVTRKINDGAVTRDALGRMLCPHETPGGAPRCALCRSTVLALHDPTGTTLRRFERDMHGPGTGSPMPDWFRRQLEELLDREQPTPTQQLDLFDEAER